MKARVLVTGGAGFIGSNIVAELVQRGERVRVLDNFATGRRENIAPYLSQVELIEGDLRHPETVREAVGGVDYVLHQGALPSVQRSIKDPLATNEVNAQGTLSLLIAARDAGVKRVVYASSSSIYGDSPTLPKAETMKPAPKSPYAASKLAGEHYCQVFHEVYGLETVCLRYFNVFGPNQDPTSEYSAVIPKFITAMLVGERPVIYGDGLQSRDFTFVVNVVEANLLAVDAEGVRRVQHLVDIDNGLLPGGFLREVRRHDFFETVHEVSIGGAVDEFPEVIGGEKSRFSVRGPTGDRIVRRQKRR